MAFTLHQTLTLLERDYFDIKAEVYIEQSAANNYTDLYVKIVAEENGTFGGYALYTNVYFFKGFSIGTETYDVNYEIREQYLHLNGTSLRPTLYTSPTKRIYHNVMGKASPVSVGLDSIGVSVAEQWSSYEEITWTSSTVLYCYGTVNFPDINRNPVILTANNITDSENPYFTFDLVGTSDITSCKAWISFNGVLDYVNKREVPTSAVSYTIALTDTERSALVNAVQGATSKTIYYHLSVTRSVNGSTNTFSAEATRTFTVEGCNPTLNPVLSIVDDTTLTLTGNSNTVIKYYSDVDFTINSAATKGATITSESIRCGNQVSYNSSGMLYNVESNSFRFSCTDSRGNTVTQTITKNFVDYIKLTCNIDNTLPDTDGNFNFRIYGNYFNQSFGAVQNTLTVEYRYKTEGASYSNWAAMTVTANADNTYTARVSIAGLDYKTKYVFQARATDKLMSIVSVEKPIKTTPVFDWSGDDFNFNVPVTINGDLTVTGTINNEGVGGGGSSDTVDGDFNITGNLRLKGSGNYGNTLYFGDGSYTYLQEATDDVLTIKATKLQLNATSGVYVNNSLLAVPESGDWTPTLSSSAVSSYTTQSGWYQRVGNVVTVGFFIKANCNSGYSSTSISIGGLPFTPMYSAAGSGMCSGVYVSAGFNFQCFVAETSGAITTRVQACNNTSAANLSTSASGCFYRNSGGEITLSGTICFVY